MTDSRRGKKQNNRRNHSAREVWMKDKKENRPRQVWVWDFVCDTLADRVGHWEKRYEFKPDY